MLRVAIAIVLLALMTSSVIAAKPAVQLDAAGARRSAALAEQLRCLVCQNQSIAESSAELAVDLRREINEQIRAGRSDSEIVDFMVARYGDFVLYRPPVKRHTLLLWFGPALLATAALIAFMRALRNRRRRMVERPLTDAEHAEAERLLGGPAKSTQ
ncbi:MAG TPA: cytochrome c-type biogenesis protein [Burkholderiaceae bacterium]|nr:cytochrome c-type biogenesis protein [Burkholderiaceae bacterium]